MRAAANAQTLTDMIQVDANVQPGDSGGPLVDANAKVVGIDAAASSSGSRYRTAEHEGFAIPINRALSIAKSIEDNPNASSGSGSSRATGGYLGVQVDPTSSARGAAVVGVQSNSPAKSAGLKSGRRDHRGRQHRNHVSRRTDFHDAVLCRRRQRSDHVADERRHEPPRNGDPGIQVAGDPNYRSPSAPVLLRLVKLDRFVWRCHICGAARSWRHGHCKACGTARGGAPPFPAPQ